MTRTPSDPTLRDRILKVMRLADQGVGGEKANAEALLEKLLRKHGLSRDALQIDQEERDFVWHPYGTEQERELLGCIARCACQRSLEFSKPSGSKKKVMGFEATPSEHIAVTVLCDVYFPKWKEACFELMLAFVFRHELTDTSERPDDDEREPMDKARAARLVALMDGLERVQRPAKRLGAGASP